MTSIRNSILLASIASTLLSARTSFATTQPIGPEPEAMGDAWWTGPLLAPNAATLPQGHFYVEPYLYDELPYTRYDNQGRTHPAPYGNDFGSLTYINYGLTDRLTVGMIPKFGYDRPAGGPASSDVGVGDLTLQAQYRLTRPDPHSWVPIASINVQETLPTGRYDRLRRTSDGFGSGAYTTTLSAYFMWYFWLPDGRILRTRFDVSYAIPEKVSVADESVYGTPAGFRGHADPGRSVYGDLAFEYSLTRNWVLACDFWLQADGDTWVAGSVARPDGLPVGFYSRSGADRELYVAPAVEYNWSARLGVIIGARVLGAGRNVTGTVTPVAAISYFD